MRKTPLLPRPWLSPCTRDGAAHSTWSWQSPKGWAVADVGLKSLGMDHGNPEVDGCGVFFCSDEHTTLLPEGDTRLRVGDRVRVTPAHVDPTIAYHEAMHLAAGPEPDAPILETWAVDLRGW